jgi:SAM-dependent methyltransferase
VNKVAGTAGYEKVVDQFIEASQALDFSLVNRHFLAFLPVGGGRVLDAGAGAGQNAAALAKRGYSVVAVEPMPAFLNAARLAYEDLGVVWIEDSLPLLEKLGATIGQFDFVLVQAVWHHLDEAEREQGMARLAALLDDGGAGAISLRHGPAGAGKHVFPTDGRKTAALANRCGLDIVLHLADQPSLMKNKPGVTWTHMVFRKRKT